MSAALQEAATDAALSTWLTECPGSGTTICSSVGDLALTPAARSIKFETSNGLSTVVAAAYVGASCYAVAGGKDVTEAKRWLAYRLGLTADPQTDPVEEPCAGEGS